ncbi:MAG: hypothetical protein ING88_07505, partial [Cytophagales bacterium]|nr:hypothetical protein [Cytophagales bacterium]
MKLGFVLLLLFAVGMANGQTITTNAITGSPFCAGQTVSVPYTITGSYGGGNVFTAQLSNATGSFAAPTAIGTLTTTAAGTITATIPLAQGAGTGYRIRVISSSPVINGTNNGTDLTINSPRAAAPTYLGATLTGATSCAGVSFDIDNNLTNGCNFGSGNVFTVQLGRGAGFTGPITVGTVNATSAGAITITLPNTLAT